MSDSGGFLTLKDMYNDFTVFCCKLWIPRTVFEGVPDNECIS